MRATNIHALLHEVEQLEQDNKQLKLALNKALQGYEIFKRNSNIKLDSELIKEAYLTLEKLK